MKDLLSSNHTLTSIYLLCNSANMLYRQMRKNYFVNSVLAKFQTDELINEFERRKASPVANTIELAEIYAIFVALTFKDDPEDFDKVKAFFENAKKIQFEWFSEIARIHLKTFDTITTYNMFTLPDLSKIPVSVKISTKEDIKSDTFNSIKIYSDDMF